MDTLDVAVRALCFWLSLLVAMGLISDGFVRLRKGYRQLARAGSEQARQEAKAGMSAGLIVVGGGAFMIAGMFVVFFLVFTR